MSPNRPAKPFLTVRPRLAKTLVLIAAGALLAVALLTGCGGGGGGY